MTVTVYDPKITVTLFKMVKRVNGVSKRYAGLRRQIDLTPLLGDGGSVRTSKSLTAPGGFSISFPDQPDEFTGDSLYALVEPMDMIEIRASRNPGQYAGAKLPLLMRGFVYSISRPEAMGADGTPQRYVVVEGQDFTKLWLNYAVYWAYIYDTDPDLNSFWAVGATIGMAPVSYTASEFVIGMVKIMNAKVANLAAFAAQTIEPFSVAATVTQGVATPNLISGVGQGSYWDILTSFADQPWNEIFVRDLEAGPQVVYRPVPWKDTKGNFIMPGAADPGSFTIDISDVVSISPARSDDGIANIFLVNSNPSTMQTGNAITDAALADGTQLDFKNPNNDPTLYGMKIMQVTSNLVPGLPPIAYDNPNDTSDPGTADWWLMRTQQLKALNRDNSVWENGSAMLKGNEEYVPGEYMKLTRGSLTSTSYVTQVDHAFIPFQSWTSQVQFIRGDGFLIRDSYAGNPFWAEGRLGLYD